MNQTLVGDRQKPKIELPTSCGLVKKGDIIRAFFEGKQWVYAKRLQTLEDNTSMLWFDILKFDKKHSLPNETARQMLEKMGFHLCFEIEFKVAKKAKPNQPQNEHTT